MHPSQSPSRCVECGKLEVYSGVISYTARVRHDGSLYILPIKDLNVQKCRSCGEVVFDSATNDQISQALRDHLRLLSPQEIRQRLTTLGLTQKGFASRLRVAPETVTRWLTGAYIQSRASDQLMRFFFEREEDKVAVPADSAIAAEELGDIRAYDEAKAGTQDTIPYGQAVREIEERSGA